MLHINFDTDKASLKPDGTDAVKEIVKVLNADKALKLLLTAIPTILVMQNTI